MTLALLEQSPRLYPGKPIVPDMDAAAYAAWWGDYPDGERHALRTDLATLRQMARLLIDISTIVVHCDRAITARTGLFGLLFDAPIQIVYVAEEC